MYRIALPIKLTGERYGLSFSEGVAETDNEALAEKLRLKGLPVVDLNPAPNEDHEEPAPTEDIEPPETPEAPDDPEVSAEPEDPTEPEAPGPSPLDKMTLKQLRAYAEGHAIDVSGIEAKSNVLKKIKEAESGK